jgi:hypothetical protein
MYEGIRLTAYPWREMPKGKKDQEPTTYTPKGLRVPVPKRGDFFRNLARVAKPRKKPDDSTSRSPEDERQEH